MQSNKTSENNHSGKILLLMSAIQICAVLSLFGMLLNQMVKKYWAKLNDLKNKEKMGPSLSEFPYNSDQFRICEDKCAICLHEFSEREHVTLLHCNVKHLFHTSCAREWLTSNPICPLCKVHISPSKL